MSIDRRIKTHCYEEKKPIIGIDMDGLTEKEFDNNLRHELKQSFLKTIEKELKKQMLRNSSDSILAVYNKHLQELAGISFSKEQLLTLSLLDEFKTSDKDIFSYYEFFSLLRDTEEYDFESIFANLMKGFRNFMILSNDKIIDYYVLGYLLFNDYSYIEKVTDELVCLYYNDDNSFYHCIEKLSECVGFDESLESIINADTIPYVFTIIWENEFNEGKYIQALSVISHALEIYPFETFFSYNLLRTLDALYGKTKQDNYFREISKTIEGLLQVGENVDKIKLTLSPNLLQKLDF